LYDLYSGSLSFDINFIHRLGFSY